MALNNTNLAKIVEMQKRNRSILDRTYQPGAGKSMGEFRESVGWDNQPPSVSVKAFTNRADSPLIGKEGFDVEVIEERNPADNSDDGTKIVVKDHFTFNVQRAVNDAVKRDRGKILRHTFGGEFSSESQLNPQQRQFFNKNLSDYATMKTKEAVEAKANAEKRYAREEKRKGKPKTMAETSKEYEHNKKWFDANYGNVGIDGQTSYPVVGDAQKQQMEADARKAGIFVRFAEADPLIEDNPGLFTGDKAIRQWTVAGVGPMLKGGDDSLRTDGTRKGSGRGPSNASSGISSNQIPRMAPNGKSYISLGNGKYQEVIMPDKEKTNMSPPPAIEPVNTGGFSGSFSLPGTPGNHGYLIDPRTPEDQAKEKALAMQEWINLANKLGVNAKNVKAVGEAAKAAGVETWNVFRRITSAYAAMQRDARKTLPAYRKS